MNRSATFRASYSAARRAYSADELVVERDDDRLLAREVSIQQPDADAGLVGDLPQRRRLVASSGDQPDRRGIQAVSCRGPLQGLAPWTAPFSRDWIYQ